MAVERARRVLHNRLIQKQKRPRPQALQLKPSTRRHEPHRPPKRGRPAAARDFKERRHAAAVVVRPRTVRNRVVMRSNDQDFFRPFDALVLAANVEHLLPGYLKRLALDVISALHEALTNIQGSRLQGAGPSGVPLTDL